MPLHGSVVEKLRLLDNDTAANYRPAGCDLTVGNIYVPKEGWLAKGNHDLLAAPPLTEFEIPPHGVAVIFSKETISLPPNICAYAMPKTSLCAEGILVFNTGIVDDTYAGCLSGTTVNFTSKPYRIRAGQPFLRLVFHEIHDTTQQPTEPIATASTPDLRKAYADDKIVKSLAFPQTFLDIPNTVKKVTKVVARKERNFLLVVIAVMSLVIGIATVVPTVIPKDWLPNTPTRHELDELAKEYADRENIESLVNQLKQQLGTIQASAKAPGNLELATQIDDLKRELNALRSRVEEEPSTD